MKVGSRLAHRYLVEASAAFDVPGAEAWLAHDERLGRPVVVLVLTDAESSIAEAAAQQARGIRDPRLARIIEVGRVDFDDETVADQPFVVIERPKGIVVADLVSQRIVPPEVARAIIGEAASSLTAAAERGLTHGALDAAWLTVTPRGKVVVGGAGIVAALASARPKAGPMSERQDARALATIFVRAVTGLAPDSVTPGKLPKGLTKSERALVAAVAKGGGPETLADVTRALTPWDASLLRGLSLREVSFEPHPDAPRPQVEVSAPAAVEPTVAVPASAPEVTPARPEPAVDRETGEDDEWSLDQLEVLEDAEPTPSVFEAFLALLHRKFPRATPITRLLERLHARATGGPKLHAQWWFLAAGVIVVVIAWMIALEGVRDPGPARPESSPHQYPDFTLAPSATPSPSP